MGSNIIPILCQSGKRKGKKKGASKDIGKDFRIPPAVSFLQCQICLAEGLVMVIILCLFYSGQCRDVPFSLSVSMEMSFQVLAGAWDYLG